MNSMQRTLAALGQREADRVPLFLCVTMHGARELGLSIEEYFAAADHVVEGQLRMRRKYRSDCLYPFFYASLETEAWGGDTIFAPDGPPNAGRPIIRDVDIDGLCAPRVADCACLQRVLDAISQLKAQVGDTVPIIGVVVSPFSLPVMQMGFERYLDLIFEQPLRFDRLMQANTAFAVDWANAQLAAGATAICYFDPVSSVTNITREQYLQTGHPVAMRTIPQIKGPTATHLASGRCLPIVDDIVRTGTTMIGTSALESLAAAKAAAAGRVTVLGNLNGVEMRRWTAQEAEAAVKQAIAQAGRGGGFILGDNHGEIPWQVPEEVLLAIADAVDRWGRYPLAWVGEKT